MVEAVAVAMEEEEDIVVDVEVAEVVAVVVSSESFPPPVPSADGTNKVVGRRFYLFQCCSSRRQSALVRSDYTRMTFTSQNRRRKSEYRSSQDIEHRIEIRQSSILRKVPLGV